MNEAQTRSSQIQILYRHKVWASFDIWFLFGDSLGMLHITICLPAARLSVKV